jgi:hypothetical protein
MVIRNMGAKGKGATMACCTQPSKSQLALLCDHGIDVLAGKDPRARPFPPRDVLALSFLDARNHAVQYTGPGTTKG